MDRIRLITFGGVSALPLYAALDIGAFEREGLDVRLELTPNSKVQIRGLLDGTYDVGSTALDNVIAYDDQEDADLFAFLGGDHSDVPLYVRPEITDELLRGATFAVDALSTGFAFVLRKILQVRGLGPDDYRLESVGGTGARWEAMQSGQVVGGIMNPPYDLLAERAGYRRLAGVYDVLGRYQGSTLVATRRWAATHRPQLHAIIRACLAGQRWLAEGYRPELVALVQRHLELPADLAEEVARRATAGPSAHEVGWGIDLEAARNVLELRREMAGLRKADLRVEEVVDRTPYEAALAGA